MTHKATARGAALLAGVAITASVTACVAAEDSRVLTRTAQVALTADTMVMAMAGLGWETVDPERIRQTMGGYFSDPAKYDVIGLPWPGEMSPWNGDLTLGQSAAVGLETMDQAVKDQMLAKPDGKIILVGASGATVVVDEEMQRLADRLAAGDPTAPTPDQISFIVLGDANRGAFRGFLGTKLPIFDLVPVAPETPYDITVVKGEYDAIGDWPDRWWNVLADLNAMAGTGLLQQIIDEDLVEKYKLDAFGSVHYDAMMADLSTVPAQNISVKVNSLGGVTTTYLVPTADLPLLRPLRALGVAPEIVDTLEKVLRPIIDSAYDRYIPSTTTGTPGRADAAPAPAPTATRSATARSAVAKAAASQPTKSKASAAKRAASAASGADSAGGTKSAGKTGRKHSTASSNSGD